MGEDKMLAAGFGGDASALGGCQMANDLLLISMRTLENQQIDVLSKLDNFLTHICIARIGEVFASPARLS